nr:MAG TPA: hypothetical protein [Caudoviricetes sp.]
MNPYLRITLSILSKYGVKSPNRLPHNLML